MNSYAVRRSPSLQFSPRQRRLGHLLFPFQDAGFFSDAWHPPDAALARTPRASMDAELAPCPAVLCAPSGLLPPRDGRCLPRATAGRSRRSQQCHWDAPTPCAVGDKGGVPDSRRQCGAPARPGSPPFTHHRRCMLSRQKAPHSSSTRSACGTSTHAQGPATPALQESRDARAAANKICHPCHMVLARHMLPCFEVIGRGWTARRRFLQPAKARVKTARTAINRAK